MDPEAVATLQLVNEPIRIVSVCGRARQGKSFILNQLLGRSSGFQVAATYRPCMKGLWSWSAPIKRTALDGGRTMASELGQFSPIFVWLLRDFYLDLVEDNRKITPRDYLEIALRPVQGSAKDMPAKNETEIEQFETQGDKEVLHERFSEVMGNQQPGRVRSYGRSVTATGLKQISVQQKMEHEMESYKTSLEETLNQKLHNWTEKLTRGLHQTVSLLQSSNPGMGHHDFHGPSSRGTNSPNHRNDDVGNLSPSNGLPR